MAIYNFDFSCFGNRFASNNSWRIYYIDCNYNDYNGDYYNDYNGDYYNYKR